jgi:hypothetical protein
MHPPKNSSKDSDLTGVMIYSDPWDKSLCSSGSASRRTIGSTAQDPPEVSRERKPEAWYRSVRSGLPLSGNHPPYAQPGVGQNRTASTSMQTAARPHDGYLRQKAFLHCRVLAGEPEQTFNNLLQLAAQTCAVPMAYPSLIDRTHQWVSANVGIPHGMSSHCSRLALISPNTSADHRFSTRTHSHEKAIHLVFCRSPWRPLNRAA